MAFDEDAYFVMLHTHSGASILPLVDENEKVLLFTDPESAEQAGNESTLFGEHFGFEVFLRGCGES